MPRASRRRSVAKMRSITQSSTSERRFRISDVALSKTCRKLGIPLPPQGYWLRPEAKRGARPALPPSAAGVRTRWEVRVRVAEERPAIDPALAAKLADESSPEAAIVVPRQLTSPHKLVSLSEKALRKAKPYEGIVSCRSSEGCLSIHVAPSSVERALLLSNTPGSRVTRPQGRRQRGDARRVPPFGQQNGGGGGRRNAHVPALGEIFAPSDGTAGAPREEGTRELADVSIAKRARTERPFRF